MDPALEDRMDIKWQIRNALATLPTRDELIWLGIAVACTAFLISIMASISLGIELIRGA